MSSNEVFREGCFKDRLTDRDFVIYIFKCLVGASICYALYRSFPDHQFSWSVVSVLLVLSPESSDSIRLAYDRMKANILGASVGLAVFAARVPEYIGLCMAVAAKILLSEFVKLGGASRSALAIVLIQENEKKFVAFGSRKDGLRRQRMHRRAACDDRIFRSSK